MGEAVLRVRAHLQALARENWGEMEEQHARNLSWLRGELAQVSRSLEIAARFDHKRAARPAPFPSGDDVLETGGRVKKKQKLRDGDAEAAKASSDADAQTSDAITSTTASNDTKRQEENHAAKRTSMRTRLSTQYKPDEHTKKSRKRARPQEQPQQQQMRDPTKLKVVELRSELRERGLRTSGLKAVLLDRLLDAMEEDHSVDDSSNDSKAQHLKQSNKVENDDATRPTTASTVSSTALERDVPRETAVSAGSQVTTEIAASRGAKPSSETARSVDDSIVRESMESQRSVANAPKDGATSPAKEPPAKDWSATAGDPESSHEVVPEDPEAAVAAVVREEKDTTRHVAAPLHSEDSRLQDTTTDARDEQATVGIGSSTERTSVAEPASAAESLAGEREEARAVEMTASSSAATERELVESAVSQPRETVAELSRSWKELQAATKAAESNSTAHDDAAAAVEPVNADISTEPKITRKSMQVRGTEEASDLQPKRKSILRKATSLAPRNRRPLRKVSFAEKGKVDIIVENSQLEITQPESSSRKEALAPASATSVASAESTASDEASRARSTSLPKVATPSNLQAVATPEAPLSSSPIRTEETAAPKASSFESVKMTEAERKRKMFQESVAREADRLRKAAKLSAKKRYEQSKASDAFWKKREQLKKLQSSAAPVADSTSPNHVATSASITSDASVTKAATAAAAAPVSARTPSSNASPSDHSDHREATSEVEITTTRAEIPREVVDLSSTTSPTPTPEPEPEHVHQSTTKAAPAAESVAPRAVENEAATTSSTHVASDKNVKDVQATDTHSNGDREARRVEKSASKPVVVSSSKLIRAESVSSSASSASDSSVEAESKTDTSASTDGARKPIANLISGLHSFTTLLEKDTKSGRNSNGGGRNAPVVNALKLAEKSRLQEQKKQLEKEKRKAALKRKIDEQKKTAAALKEKAERDAQAKREQERLNERKKREAELAKRRQQKIQEMRAGLEKKRAQLAAERRNARLGASSKPVGVSSASTASSHRSKNHGLASASEAAKPVINPTPKPVSKPAVQKPVAQIPAPKTVAPKPAPKPSSRPAAPAKPAKPRPAAKTQPPEVVNYEMSDNGESGGDDSDSEGGKHGSKNIPRWAQKENLNKTLRAQFGKHAVDPSPSIFVDFVDTCDLEAIFETADVRKKKRFQRRTSSGNWLADRPTARDRALYDHEMGYHR